MLEHPAGQESRPVVIVTGAGHGIGASIALELASKRQRQVVAVDCNESRLERLAHPAITRCVADVSVLADHARIVDAAQALGPVAGLVNNAAAQRERSFMETDAATFDVVYSTNVRGPWFLSRTLVSRRKPGETPAIVFISSLHDHRTRGTPAYSTSKAAVAMLVREMAAELGPEGIRVNAVSPGWIPTEDGAVPPEQHPSAPYTPLRRAGRTSEVASIVIALLDDQISAFVTGVNIPVDGGLDLFGWMSPEAPRTK